MKLPIELSNKHNAKLYELPEYLTVIDDADIAETFTSNGFSPKIDKSEKKIQKRRLSTTGGLDDDLYKMMMTTVEISNPNLHFLEAGDVLAGSGYEVEGLHDANHSIGKVLVALEVATYL